MNISERELIRLGQVLAKKIRKALIRELKSDGRKKEPDGVKDSHVADSIAFEIIKKETESLKASVWVEGFETIRPEYSDHKIFIDPLDGSRNWERQIGDPAFALAYCSKGGDFCFGDLSFAYIEGLRSGDVYFTLKGKVFYRSKLLNRKFRLQKRQAGELINATAYIKPGYSAAEKALRFAEKLIPQVKDIRAIDNSASELCELARGACDLIIEARDLSDFHNLLAYPILKICGCQITDLKGKHLDNQKAIPGAIYNFMAFGSEQIKNESLSLLKP